MSQVTMPDGTVIEAEGCITITKPNYGGRLYVNGSVYIAPPEPCSESQEPLLSYEDAEWAIVSYLADMDVTGQTPSIFFHPWGNDHYEIVAFGCTDVFYGDETAVVQDVPVIDSVYVSYEVARELGWLYHIDID